MKTLRMELFFTTILTASLISLSTWAHKHDHEKKPRDHGSHVHGQATLAIAFDDLKGQIEFKGASEGIVGFEHVAKSSQDKKKLADVADSFEKNITNYIQFAATSNCAFKKTSIDMVKQNTHSNHSDFLAKFEVTCAKSILNSSLNLDFTSLKKLTDIDVTVLISDLQIKSEIKSKKITIELR